MYDHKDYIEFTILLIMFEIRERYDIIWTGYERSNNEIWDCVP